MKGEQFRQPVCHEANSIIAITRQNPEDPRLKKKRKRLAKEIGVDQQLQDRVSNYIISESRVTAGGGPDTSGRRWGW